MRLAAVLVIAAAAPVASADVYLSSVNLWLTNQSTGANVGGPYEFTNLTDDSSAEIRLNGAPRGTSIQLTEGDNAFTFLLPSFIPATSPHAFGFWFTTSAATYSGPAGELPHLVAYRDVNGNVAFAQAGASVNTLRAFSTDASYGGNTSFALDGFTISVSQIAFSRNGDQQAFTITVVPAPAGAALALMLAPLASRRKR